MLNWVFLDFYSRSLEFTFKTSVVTQVLVGGVFVQDFYTRNVLLYCLKVSVALCIGQVIINMRMYVCCYVALRRLSYDISGFGLHVAARRGHS